MKTIWILNHHARQEGHRHFELALEFAKHGYRTVIFSSSFSHVFHNYLYDEACHIENLLPSVTYVYLHTSPTYSNNGIKRVQNMFSYLRMVKKFAPQIWEQYGKPDYVIGSCVHPLAWEAAYWVSRKCKARFICEVRDLWPLSLIEINGMNPHHPLVLFFSAIERRAYNRASKIVTTFPYGYQYICNELGYPAEKVLWIPNGIRVEAPDNSESPPHELVSCLNEHWCCIYTGSLVKSECIDYMLKAFALLKDTEIWFVIVGNGHEQPQLEKMIEEQSLEHVRMFPRISKAQVMTVLQSAKCCLASVDNLPIYRYGLSMNKLNDYLLSGTPIIFACDVKNPIQETDSISIPKGDPLQLAQEIILMYNRSEQERKHIGDSGRQIITEQYSYDVIARKYLNMLEGLSNI